jgi:MHS family citrate/tricarballylate:H+ symporter-like MFS transporter
VLKLTESDALLVTSAVAASNFFWLPVSGALSDRIGRKPILVAFAILALLTAYPALAWLVREPTFDRMLAIELWLSFIYACYNGAMVVALTEVIPASVRTSGVSLAQPRHHARRVVAPDLDLVDRPHRRQGRARLVMTSRLCGLDRDGMALYRRPASGIRYAAPGAAVGG